MDYAGLATQHHQIANDTTYATQNGGEYDFVIEPENSLAIPTSQVAPRPTSFPILECLARSAAVLSIKAWRWAGYPGGAARSLVAGRLRRLRLARLPVRS